MIRSTHRIFLVVEEVFFPEEVKKEKREPPSRSPSFFPLSPPSRRPGKKDASFAPGAAAAAAAAGAAVAAPAPPPSPAPSMLMKSFRAGEREREEEDDESKGPAEKERERGGG